MSEPPQPPRTCTVDESLGTDPETNNRVRYYIQRYPKADAAEIARVMELNEWVVQKSLARMHTDPYTRMEGR